MKTSAQNAANPLGMALESSEDDSVQCRAWNFRTDSDLSAVREFLCAASEHPGGAHFFTMNDSDWVWALGFWLKFSKKSLTN